MVPTMDVNDSFIVGADRDRVLDIDGIRHRNNQLIHWTFYCTAWDPQLILRYQLLRGVKS